MEVINSLENFILSQPLIKYDYSEFTYSNNDEGIIIPFKNIVTTDYIDIIMKESAIVNLSDAECEKYRFKPKLLSYDIYGDTEFYYIILMINQLYNIKDFNLSRKTIKLTFKDQLYKILSNIRDTNIDYIRRYNSK